MLDDVEAQHILDHVQSLPHIGALEADPHAYADQLATELGPVTSRDEITTRDDRLRTALARIDELSTRVMRIRLDHVLANEQALAPPTRKVFAATVVSYEDKLELLASRAADVASRGGSRDPAAIADAVVDAARATLALRAALRHGILALIAQLSAASVPLADQTARDRRLEEAQRRAWSAVRRELEATAAQPARVVAADFTARLAAWPAQLDEPDPSSEPTVADLIELD